MNLLDRLENKLRPYAIANLTMYLVVSQIVIYVFIMANLIDIEQILLIPSKVLQGQVWRLATFLVIPPVTNPIFAFFAWYLFYLMGTSLENHWGVSRYNIYLLIGYLTTVIVSFLPPALPATNAFLGGSVFLAFAFLYPEFQLFLFFIVPVKIKWLAMITWIFYLLTFIIGTWTDRFLILASICNFLLFFGTDIIRKIKYGKKRMARQAERISTKDEPLHRCVVCRATEKTDSELEFRYCSQCQPVSCYCTEHLEGHEHICSNTY